MRLYELSQKPKSLYVSRNVLNAADIIAWAKTQRFVSTLQPHDMHVTVAYSVNRVDWRKTTPLTDNVTAVGGTRELRAFGKRKNVFVLVFDSPELSDRWQQFRDIGCSWDYDGYYPHITISYKTSTLDIDDIMPYRGKLILGPEIFKPISNSWQDTIKERKIKYD